MKRGIRIGQLVNGWKVVSHSPSTRASGERPAYVLRCPRCGFAQERRFFAGDEIAACRCRSATAPPEHVVHIEKEASAAYLDDRNCRAWVLISPIGMSLTEIHAVTGYSKERIRQIEDDALASFVREASRMRVPPDCLREILAFLRGRALLRDREAFARRARAAAEADDDEPVEEDRAA